jgi:hypothetical protein
MLSLRVHQPGNFDTSGYCLVIRSSWLLGYLGRDSGPDGLLSHFVADMAIVNP